MRKQWKGFMSGILVSVLIIGMFGTAMATAGQHTVNVDYNDIKVTLNGVAVNLVDANGAAVEPFAINGTTYLPVRAVASALGLDVNWNGQTKTVELMGKDVGGTSDKFTLGEGNYVAGVDFPAGQYDMDVVAGAGYVSIDDRRLLLADIEEFADYASLYKQHAGNVNIPEGAKVSITGIVGALEIDFVKQ